MVTVTLHGAHVSFRQIHKPPGKPISYEKVSAGIVPAIKDDSYSRSETEKNAS